MPAARVYHLNFIVQLKCTDAATDDVTTMLQKCASSLSLVLAPQGTAGVPSKSHLMLHSQLKAPPVEIHFADVLIKAHVCPMTWNVL